MKNNSGFSLVELIVVIAIMAILAGVAVPTYSKYVSKANDAAVLSELDEIKTAVIAAASQKGVNVTKIVVTDSGNADTVSVSVASGTAPDQTEVEAWLDDQDIIVDFSNTFYDGKSAEWNAVKVDTKPAGWSAQ